MAKTELFDESLQQAATYFKALSHPARLAIINYLIETGTCLLSPEIPRLGGVSVNTKSTDTSQSKSLSAAFNNALSQLPSKVIN